MIPIASWPVPIFTLYLSRPCEQESVYGLRLDTKNTMRISVVKCRTGWLVLSKWRSEVKWLSHVRLFATPWTVAHQAPPSMEFSSQESWSGLPFPSLEDLLEPGLPHCRQTIYHLSHQGSPLQKYVSQFHFKWEAHYTQLKAVYDLLMC